MVAEALRERRRSGKKDKKKRRLEWRAVFLTFFFVKFCFFSWSLLTVLLRCRAANRISFRLESKFQRLNCDRFGEKHFGYRSGCVAPLSTL